MTFHRNVWPPPVGRLNTSQDTQKLRVMLIPTRRETHLTATARSPVSVAFIRTGVWTLPPVAGYAARA